MVLISSGIRSFFLPFFGFMSPDVLGGSLRYKSCILWFLCRRTANRVQIKFISICLAANNFLPGDDGGECTCSQAKGKRRGEGSVCVDTSPISHSLVPCYRQK